MIRNIIPTLSYSFSDVQHGIVYPVQSKGGWVPGSRDGKFYKDAIPDSSKMSIVYWEDFGGAVIDSCRQYQRVRQRVRLVVWMNFGRITDKNYRQCVGEVLRAVPQRVGSTLFTFVAQKHKDINLFDRYTYNEAKQYITYPYDVAAFDYDIVYFHIRGAVEEDDDDQS